MLHRRVEEEGLLGVEYCLGGCGIGHGRLGPLSLGLATYTYSGGGASLLGFENIHYIPR